MPPPVTLKAVGSEFTVTTAVLVQVSDAGVYVIIVVPGDAPYTVPDVADASVATAVLLLVQVPAPAASVSAVDNPTHTFRVPLMAAGAVCTVATMLAKQVPPNE